MKNLISGILAVALVAGPASAQTVPTAKLPQVTVKLNGASGGGSGDITAVDIATTSPLTGGANCATGACSFTLGLTGGTLSGLTATRLPVATSATAVGDTAITYSESKVVSAETAVGRKLCFTDSAGAVTCIGTMDAAYIGQGFGVTKGVAADSAVGDMYAGNYRGNIAAMAYGMTAGGSEFSLFGSGYTGSTLQMTFPSTGVLGWNSLDTQLKRDAAGQVGIYGAGSTYGQLNVGTIQQSYSKALVDATATDVVQVPVASNSYEGFTLDYTIFATDATDYQVRQGSVPVAVLNVGGTETCVFGTATEAVNASAGTLTVAFDCTAGTNTVMVRANADTSLASTTIFTIQQRINLTSGTAVLVPQ